MCGRFSLTVDPADLQEAFPEFIFPIQFSPRFNIAPTQPILVLPNDDSNTADFFIWGLIPSWAKDASIGARLINARAETIAEKPAFRAAYRYHRCLIFASGFYEWQTQPAKKLKTPIYVKMKDGQPFSFAGLWEAWQSPDGSQLKTATIITTTPNSLIEKYHNRMPVVLHFEDYAIWLNPSPGNPDDLQRLLKPYPAEAMISFPVSTRVNSPINDQPECIQSV